MSRAVELAPNEDQGVVFGALDVPANASLEQITTYSAQVNKIIAASQHDLPRGTQVFVRGQVQTMNASFSGLLVGLLGAIVLVYLLMVVNFQSWLDPFIIITALPAALAGIVWMLFLTHTTVSVPALTGAIMCMGVATANSVLIVSFARARMMAGDDAFSAASAAGVALSWCVGRDLGSARARTCRCS